MQEKKVRGDKNWEGMALAYLGLPCMIFFVEWLRPLLAFLLVLLLAAALGMYLWQVPKETDARSIPWAHWLGLLGFGILLAYVSGLTHQFPQTQDYVKHHEIWEDLGQFEWPVWYQIGEKSFFLDYYLAYYLPASWLARLLSVSYVPLALVWGMLGLFLCLYGFYRLFPHKLALWGMILLILISGQDLLWIWAIDLLHIFRTGMYQPLPWGEITIETPVFISYNYKGLFTQLIWAPQHALGGWLATVLIIRRLKGSRGRWLTFVPLLLSFFWSPFVTLGLIPFALWDFLNNLSFSWKKLGLALILLPVGLVFLLYYLAHPPVSHTGFIWQVSTRPDWYIFYLLFIFFELATYSSLVFASWQGKAADSFEKILFLIALFSLLFIPLFHMGRNNDFVMRASIPAALIFYLTAIKALPKLWSRKYLRLALVISFGLGILIPLSETQKLYDYGQILRIQEKYPLANFDITQLNQSYESSDIYHDFDLSAQYLGDEDSFFAKYLLKRPDE